MTAVGSVTEDDAILDDRCLGTATPPGLPASAPAALGVESQTVGWGKAIRTRLGEETGGSLPVDAIVKPLARQLRAG